MGLEWEEDTFDFIDCRGDGVQVTPREDQFPIDVYGKNATKRKEVV